MHWFSDAIQPSHPVSLFSFCLQPFPASGSFLMNRLFSSGGRSIGASASASVLPVNIQGWFPLRLTGLISLLSKGLSSLLQNHSLKASILWHSAFFMVQFSHLYMTTGKAIALTIWTFVSKVISPLSNMLFVIAFLPRNKCLLISWLQSLFTVILEPKGKKNMPLFPVFEYLTEIQIFLSHCQYIRNCFSPFN